MNINLNPYSCATEQPYNDSQLITCLQSLQGVCASLNELGVGRICTSTHKENFSIGGRNLVAILQDYGRNRELSTLIVTLLSKYWSFGYKYSQTEVFDLTSSFQNFCVELADAYLDDYPVFSICTCSSWECSRISGYIADRNIQSVQACDVKNIYKEDSLNSVLLCSIKNAGKHHPGECPMWNQVAVKAYSDYINIVSVQEDMKALSPAERHAFAAKYARRIAELNGWVYDEVVTKINKSNEHLRMVYRSVHFKKTDYYLSFDFEKPSFCYELCDNKGNHLREIDFLGQQSGPARKDHSLKLSR